MQDDREERIRRRAHEIWEREGQPEGKHDEHWAQATAEVAAEDDKGSKGKAGTAKRPGKAETGKTEAAKAGAAKTAKTAKAGSTRAAAENLSAVASGKARKSGPTKKDATG